MTKSRREPQIELFRALCMFGICLLHSMTQGGFVAPNCRFGNLLSPCVVGFVFISGYFGIKLKLGRLFSLLINGLYCFVITAAVTVMLQGGGYDAFCHSLHRSMGYGWFLWMYIALMMVAPCFDSLFVEPLSGTRRNHIVWIKVLPVLFLVYVWQYSISRFPVLGLCIPSVGGFGSFTLFTFIAVYLAARTCWYYQVEKYLKSYHFVLVLVISCVACWYNLKHHNSPFALFLVASCFYLLKRINMSSLFISKTLLIVSPSLFSVYLFHTNDLGFHWMNSFETYAILGQGWNYYVACMVFAVFAFGVGVLLDIPRRLFIVSSHKIMCVIFKVLKRVTPGLARLIFGGRA